ncbi:MAG: molecular chaperone DnaJ [Candidatus Aminicenantes bacterium]|nr:molecular chaperone DnaJ [Candidatus Aminicenantes bacterium]
MSDQDYYEILGASRTASAEEIKKCYRQMALRYHPDRNPGDKTCEERFKSAAEAYSILGDPQKRETYDRFGKDGLRGSGFEGFSGSIFEDFEDILGNFFGFNFGFGGGARRARPARGRDLGLEVEITLEEAAAGVEKEIAIQRAELCPSCGGSKARAGTRPSVCPSCGGRGQVRRTQGFFSVATTCSHCRGSGEIISSPCEDCRGTGRKAQKRTLKVRIPAGAGDGVRLRLTGEGEAGEAGGAGRGDLYVDIRVKAHDIFERENNNLACSLSLSFVQASLGITAEIPVLSGGTEKLKIPAGTQSGEVFRLKGCGVKDLQRHRTGDLFVTVDVRTPGDLKKEEKELLRKFAELRRENLDRLDAGAVRRKTSSRRTNFS